MLIGLERLELSHPRVTDFKSGASTNSATAPCLLTETSRSQQARTIRYHMRLTTSNKPVTIAPVRERSGTLQVLCLRDVKESA